MIAEFKIELPKFTEVLSEVRKTHPFMSEVASSAIASENPKISKRLLRYSWLMLQEDYTDQELLNSYKAAESAVRKNYPLEYENSLLSRIDNLSIALISKIAQLIEDDNLSLTHFFEKYKIQKDTKLGIDLIKYYFETCNSAAFSVNKDIFISIIQNADIDNLNMIKHYLDVLDSYDYIDEINETLIRLYGEPGSNAPKEDQITGGNLWDHLEEHQLSKFINWLKTRELKEYFGDNNLKLSLWSKYFAHIKFINYSEEGILIIELPKDYVVVDLTDKLNQSYLYKKSLFELKHKQFVESRKNGVYQWPVEDRDVITLKDAQIKGISKNVYIITYEGVGRLYTMEIIESCLQ